MLPAPWPAPGPGYPLMVPIPLKQPGPSTIGLTATSHPTWSCHPFNPETSKFCTTSSRALSSGPTAMEAPSIQMTSCYISPKRTSPFSCCLFRMEALSSFWKQFASKSPETRFLRRTEFSRKTRYICIREIDGSLRFSTIRRRSHSTSLPWALSLFHQKPLFFRISKMENPHYRLKPASWGTCNACSVAGPLPTKPATVFACLWPVTVFSISKVLSGHKILKNIPRRDIFLFQQASKNIDPLTANLPKQLDTNPTLKLAQSSPHSREICSSIN